MAYGDPTRVFRPPASRSILVSLGLLLGCGGPPPAPAADAAPRRDAIGPCGTASEAQPGSALVAGRFHVTWTAPCGIGSINPLAATDTIALDTDAGTVAFSDDDGGCVECGAVQHGTIHGRCIDLDATMVGSTKVLDAYALCATTTGLEGVQIWSGYPGPPEAEGWLLVGVPE